MIVDEELDKINLEKQQEAETSEAKPVEVIEPTVQPLQVDAMPNQTVDTNVVNIQTQFSKKMDEVKENVLVDAAETDNQFVETIKKNVKETAVKLTEVEHNKAEYQGQQVDYEKEKLETKQKKNIHEQAEDKWVNRQKRRQYHYDGVKPIMKFVKIDDPMNLFCLYFLTVILIIPFLIGKFIRGTFGALVAGASDSNRGRTARGFLWTITCVFATLVLICLVYLFLKWQGIDLLANIKN